MRFNIKLNILIFIIITIITIISISFYNIISPKQSVKSYNYTSFPKISPKNLPDPAIAPKNSCSTGPPKECDSAQSCSFCTGNDDFKCYTPSPGDTQRIFTDSNNVKYTIPNDGKSYCVPNTSVTKNNHNHCNTYTGSWLWSSSADCPDGKNQCWSCECKYPGLYKDGANRCQTKQACQAMYNGEDLGKDNKLVLTDAGYNYFNGKYPKKTPWDPLSKTDTAILTENPYSVNDQGESLFACSCAQNLPTSKGETKYFVDKPLPGDPYSCHLDQCWKSLLNSNSIQGVKLDTSGKPSCDCSGGGANGVKIPSTLNNSKLAGLCAIGTFCNGNTTQASCNKNSDNECVGCNCGTDIGQRECSSNNYPSPGSPQCSDPDNPIGKECYNPCLENPNPCGLSGATCSPSVNAPYYTCKCPDGKIQARDCDDKLQPMVCDDQCKNCKFPDGSQINFSTIGARTCSYPRGYPQCSRGDVKDCCATNTSCTEQAGGSTTIKYCGTRSTVDACK